MQVIEPATRCVSPGNDGLPALGYSRPCTINRVRGLRTDASITLDHIYSLFGDHDGRRIRVPANQRRHHRRIDNAQALQTAHAQLRVYYRVSVLPHPASADRMIDGIDAPFQRITNLIVRVHVRGKQVLRDPFSKSRRLHQVSRELEPLHHAIEIERVVEERWIDTG